MLKKKLLLISFITILITAILHYLSIKLNWYFTFKQIDIIVHILGGFWIAITAIWFCLEFKHIETIINYKTKYFIAILVYVLIIGVIWEIFELISGNTFLHSSNFWTDSTSDMINNFLGGFIAYVYFIRMKNYKSETIK